MELSRRKRRRRGEKGKWKKRQKARWEWGKIIWWQAEKWWLDGWWVGGGSKDRVTVGEQRSKIMTEREMEKKWKVKTYESREKRAKKAERRWKRWRRRKRERKTDAKDRNERNHNMLTLRRKRQEMDEQRGNMQKKTKRKTWVNGNGEIIWNRETVTAGEERQIETYTLAQWEISPSTLLVFSKWSEK